MTESFADDIYFGWLAAPLYDETAKHIISPKNMCYSRLLQNVWCKSAHILRICRLVYIVMLMLAGCDTLYNRTEIK